eukprot:7989377-Pyramimonas_sp.AAC.1
MIHLTSRMSSRRWQIERDSLARTAQVGQGNLRVYFLSFCDAVITAIAAGARGPMTYVTGRVAPCCCPSRYLLYDIALTPDVPE